jgi:Ion channel
MPPETRERAHYGFLLLVTVGSLAVQGTVEPSALQRIAVTALAGASLLLAFRAARLSPRLIALAAGIAAAALAVSIVRAAAGGIGEGAALTVNAALVGFGPPAIAVGLVRDLRARGVVQIQSLFGVLSLYMLIGMAFGFVYGAIDAFGGDPFFTGGNSATVAHCLYFSFTTLATVGYGDFVARTDLGHTLAVSEALLGQIYLVTVVSLIVTNLRRPVRTDGSAS